MLVDNLKRGVRDIPVNALRDEFCDAKSSVRL
jgi:hypothetical protein